MELAKGSSPFDLIDLTHALGDTVARKEDVVTYRSLHHLLRDRVLSEQVSIYTS